MIYSDFQDLSLSALGLGCMRLPVVDGNDGVIDVEASKDMVAYAMENGINYFDTAWGYHQGNSELVAGELLSAYPRDSYYLASKFPGYDLSTLARKEEIFEKQLQKCRVDYFDFYLFHNVCEMNIDAYLDPEIGLYDFLMAQKKAGKIRHLGFSAHGSMEVLERFLEAYGEDMEFCQLQVNWLDWEFQNAKEKVELMRRHHIPVWVMEPVRGGSLVKLSESIEARLQALAPGRSLPEWAFRFLQSIDGVSLTLSGMSNMQQLKENIKTYQTACPLSETEWQTLIDIAREMTNKETVPCTACRYCTTHCPLELDIPWLIELYNEHCFSGGGFIAPMALSALDESKKPTACLSCRACEAVCPQQIAVADVMKAFADYMK